MPESILIATPHAAFGELIRLSLEESKQYQVRLVQSAKEARAACNRAAAASRVVYALAILDSDLKDEAFVPLCSDLLELQPGIRLVVIPPQNNPNHPSLGGLMPHGYLNRPFYLPDLLETVAHLLSERQKQMKSQDLPAGDPSTAWTPSATIPAWFKDPPVMEDYLNRLLAETTATEALLGASDARPGPEALLAFAGRMEPAAARELAMAALRYWKHDESADLMRFIRLPGHKKDFLVYATQVVSELVLILVYDSTATLSQVRPQTRAMAQSLAGLPPQPGLSQADAAPAEPPGAAGGETRRDAGEPPAHAPVPAANEPVTQMDDHPLSGYTLEQQANQDEPAARAARSSAQIYPAFDNAENAATEEEYDEALINLSALLGAIPEPDPGEGPAHGQHWIQGADIIPNRGAAGSPPAGVPPEEAAGEWQPEQPEPSPVSRPTGKRKMTEPLRMPLPTGDDPIGPLQQAEERLAAQGRLPGAGPNLPADGSLPLPPPDTHRSGRPASTDAHTEPPLPPLIPASAIEPNRLAAAETAPQASPTGADDRPAPPPGAGQSTPLSPGATLEPPIDPLGDTRPRVISGPTHLGQLEPASAAVSLLTYTCVLVPRLPQHYLAGELVEHLYGWVQQLCLAFGWRLEGISIRPEYLQWSLQVAPSISPGNIVRIIRQRTSMHIFNTFPTLTVENPSGDFWAIGYLIVSGIQPPSAQLMREFIAQTRKRQGLQR